MQIITMVLCLMVAVSSLPYTSVLAQTSNGQTASDWSNYSYDQKDQVVNQLRDKIHQIDSSIGDIKKSDASQETKNAQISTKNAEKDRLNDAIRMVQNSNSSQWSSVRSQAQSVYNQTNR